MSSLFGPDMSPVVKFGLILAIILFLVGAFALILRRMTGGKLTSSGAEHNRNRQPRLGIIDVYDLDRTRQLVLLRRDNVEHLLLVGGPNDVVIETNIVRVPAAKNVVSDIQVERTEPVLEQTSRIGNEPQMRPTVDAGRLWHGTNEHLVEAVPQNQNYSAPVFNVPNAEPPTASVNIAQLQPEAHHQQISFSPPPAVEPARIDYTQNTQEEALPDIPDFLREQRPPRNQTGEVPALMTADFEDIRQDPIVPANQPNDQAFVAPVTDHTKHQEPEAHYSPQHKPVFKPDPRFFNKIRKESPVSEYPVSEHREVTQSDNTIIEQNIVSPAPLENHSVVQTDPVFQEIPLPSEETVKFEQVVEVPAPIDNPVEMQAPRQENPIQLDETILSDMARQLEEALKAEVAYQSSHSEAETVLGNQQEQTSPPDNDPILEQMISEAPQHEVVANEIFVDQSLSKTEDTVYEEHISSFLPQEQPTILAEEPVEEFKPQQDAETGTDKKSEDIATSQKVSLHPKADPFSLDDIEAEFARLLGRSEDKSSKS